MDIKYNIYELEIFGMTYVMLKIMKKLGMNKYYLQVRRQNKLCHFTFEELENYLKHYYENRMGSPLDLKKPDTYCEKIQWMKLYDSTFLKTRLADKYLAREYVREKVGEKYLIPLIGVWENVNDIDFNQMPNCFVLKANHGSGMNIIIKDKRRTNYRRIQKKLNQWLTVNYAYEGLEMHYRAISPKIIAEEYIENINNVLYDYKFHCFNGVVRAIHVIGDRNIDKHTAREAFYDVNWNRQNYTTGTFPMFRYDIKKPEALDEMIKVVEKLSEGFKYVRIDLYYVDNKVLFGEFTFTPGGGFYRFEPVSIDKEWGTFIEL